MTKKHGADDDKVVIPAERILKGALKRDLESAVVLSWTREGEPYFASGLADGGDILWLIEKCKPLLMNGGYND